MPMPSPTVMDGSAFASRTVTVPGWYDVNVRMAMPFGAITPFSVSVPGPPGVEGDGDVVLLSLLHPAPSAARASSATAGQVRRV